MSSKGKSPKQVSTTPVTSNESRSVGRDRSFTTHGAQDRSPSPVVISRVEEKNQLASLNDRLAIYIDRVRRLEADNERLTKITSETEENTRREVNGLKGMYDAELAEARRLLDQVAKDKAKFQLDVGRFQSQLQELQAKLTAKDKSEADLKQRLIAAESQIGDLQSRVNDSSNQKRRLEEENGRLSKELSALSKQLATTVKEVETETMKRVEFENRNKTLQEALTFQNQVHRKEVDELTSRRRIEVEQVDGRLQQEYENRLSETLQQMRYENDEQIRKNRAEVEMMYETKMADCQAAMQKCQETTQKSQLELRQATKRCEELTAETARLSSLANASNSKLETLERLLQRERDEHQGSLAQKDAEIRRLRKAVDDQLVEYRDLLDIKIQLDAEIATYRKLLELEETRLNSSSPGPSSSSKQSTPAATASAESSGSGSRKRKIVESEEVSSCYISDQYAATAAGLVGVEIHSVDPEGAYVRLFNNTDKNINISGWTLTQKGGAAEVSHKFPQRTLIKPHQVFTIWSKMGSPSHGLSEQTMKSQAWLATDNIKTVLTDIKGEEVACRESRFGTRSSITTTELHESQSERSSSSWGFGALFTLIM